MGEWTDRRFPISPSEIVGEYAPSAYELHALSQRQFPDSIDPVSGQVAKVALRGAVGTLPPGAPDWMQAARALSRDLEQLIARGVATEFEQGAIDRAWAAWSLAGASRRQILRVAHVVTRAHAAIRETSRERLEQAYHDCAGVLLGGLPSPVRQHVPFERVLMVVRQLRNEADAWAAVVDATAELLGWKDYVRAHAAAVIRLVIEQGEE